MRSCERCNQEKTDSEFCSGVSRRWDRSCLECHDAFKSGFHGKTFTKAFRTHEKTAYAKGLLANATNSERALWERLRSRTTGVRFRRQVIMFGYILDFYSFESKLCVELDGKHHEHQADYDARRDAALAARGIKTLRFPSKKVFDDAEGIVAEISRESLARIGVSKSYAIR